LKIIKRGDVVGIGYVVGCCLSVLLWKLDRTAIFNFIFDYVQKIFKRENVVQVIYLTFLFILIFVLNRIHDGEIYNFITAFIIIDISNTERKNLNHKDKAHFYNSISTISRSLLCGFVAPLFLVLLLGNAYAIAYMLLYNICYNDRFKLLKIIFNLLNIIPALILELLLFIVYLFRNKKANIDFKGDFLNNSINKPLLNVDILGAYIESVNFYYYFNEKDMYYIKSYGEYANKIDEICIKDYLSIGYGICIVYFLVIFLIYRII
jgi:hypothetical protein